MRQTPAKLQVQKQNVNSKTDSPVALKGFMHHLGEYVFEERPLRLRRDGAPVLATDRQLALLKALYKANGEIKSRESLMNEVWGDAAVEDHNITQTVFTLRRLLGKLPNGNEYIQTVTNRGYRLSPDALPLISKTPLPVVQGGEPSQIRPTSSSALIRAFRAIFRGGGFLKAS